MNFLIILNDAPYGTERSYNGLRLAKSLIKDKPDGDLTIFLMADAVTCAKKDQRPPGGYYNVELMLKAVVRHGKVLLCGSCMDARGLTEGELIDGTRRSDMETLSNATYDADKALVF